MDRKRACKIVQFGDTNPADQNPDLLNQKEVFYTDNTTNTHSNLCHLKRETRCCKAGLSFSISILIRASTSHGG